MEEGELKGEEEGAKKGGRAERGHGVEVKSNCSTCLLEPKNKAGLMHMPRNILGQRGHRTQTGPASIPIRTGSYRARRTGQISRRADLRP